MATEMRKAGVDVLGDIPWGTQHQFAVTKRRGSWDVIETAGHKQAKAEIKRAAIEPSDLTGVHGHGILKMPQG